MSYKLVLVRHGESEWNKANLFTGWTDVDLSENGVAEAKRGGQLLKEEGFTPKENLLFTAYCDEEKGGSHGALASVLKYPART